MRTAETFFTADVVLLARVSHRWHVLLIERAKQPFRGSLALPGGHVEGNETSLAAARRELVEETGLDIAPLRRVDFYDAPDRDPRGRYVSVAYMSTLDMAPAAVAGDDAASATWVPLADILYGSVDVAFDHVEIITDAAAKIGIGSWGGTPVIEARHVQVGDVVTRDYPGDSATWWRVMGEKSIDADNQAFWPVECVASLDCPIGARDLLRHPVNRQISVRL
ncbi:NUDIX domain-containing protein [Lentzea sp. CA-135723]|uniref:NUDIX domain-containing protein n=1 Tax=Lentzea sp. CA-135723 TaxID=3239950 RepID=UPI003D8BE383